MSGEELRKKLLIAGYVLKDVSEKLCVSQQNFNCYLKVADVKTGLLEQLCDKLNLTMDFFYGNTKYSKKTSNNDTVCRDDKDLLIANLCGQIEAYKVALGIKGASIDSIVNAV
ncbi:MAG: helix-turn-helix domain-containing protein [Prevotella sp.]